MRKLLAVVAVAGLAVLGMGMTTDRTAPQVSLIQKLNGSPLFMGRISTDGGYARSNCTTPETKFDIDAGVMTGIVCNYDHTYKPLTGACTVQAGATDWPIYANQPFITLLVDAEKHVSVRPADAGVLGACDFYRMR